MGVKFTNNAETTISSGINNSVTTIPVASSSTFPSISGSNYFYATLDDGTNLEVVKVTAISGTNWTVVRAQDDTTARAWSSGDDIQLRLNVALLEDALGDAATFARDSFTGDGSTTAFTLSQTAASENNLIVFIEGVFQTQSAYSLSGTSLTFSAAPANTREIIVYSTQALSAGTVTTASIVDDNVTQAKIADDAVGADQLAASAVVTASIVDDNVTQAKIADDAVGADQLASSAVVTASIVDDAVTTAKIADDQVTLAKMAGLARGKIIYGDSSGNPAALALGSNGQVLKSDGTDIAWSADSGAVTAVNNATANELVTIGSTTTELDGEANLTFDGSALQVTGTLTVGVDDTGHDVKFFGATASKYMLWDESADSLIVKDVVDAVNFKVNGGQGSDGQVLTSTGSGVAWEDASSFNADAAQVFNDSGNDVDFRVESNDSANMLFVNGGDNNVSINANNTASVTNSATALAARTLVINGNEGEGSDNLSFFAMADGTGNYGMEVSNSAHTAQYDLLINPINKGGVIIGGTTSVAHGNVDDLQIGDNTGSRGISINSANDGNGAIFFADPDSSLSGQIEYGHSTDALYFITGGNQRARLDVHGLKFGSDSAEANALDDYEEGTWTPTVGGNTGQGTTSSGSIAGKYIKIGKLVTASFSIANVTLANASGHLKIGGFPFNNDGTNDREANGVMRTYGVDLEPFSDHGSPVPAINDNNNYGFVLQSKDNAAWAVVQVDNGSGQYFEGTITYIAT